MTFEEWNNEHWKAKYNQKNNTCELKAPGTTYIFTKHDFLQLAHNINSVAEHIYDKEVYYIHDGDVFNRETGEQLLGVIDDCEKLNEQHKQIKQLEEVIASLQAQLFQEQIID